MICYVANNIPRDFKLPKTKKAREWFNEEISLWTNWKQIKTKFENSGKIYDQVLKISRENRPSFIKTLLCRPACQKAVILKYD